MNEKKFAIIVAGGSGSRMQSEIPKQFLFLKDKPIIAHTINTFLKCNCHIIVVLPENHLNTFKNTLLTHCDSENIELVIGGKTRFESVKNGLSSVNENALVAIHDAVRPFVTTEIINTSFETAKEYGSAICSVDLKDSIRFVSKSGNESKDRTQFKLIQTPQTFQSTLLLAAYSQEYNDSFTDDASVLEANGGKIQLIEGDYKNIKITTPEDLLVANAFIR